MRRWCGILILACAACSAAVAASDIYLTDAIKNPAYLAALSTLLETAPSLPGWTRQVLNRSGNYVGTPVVYATIDGARYELFHACMAHDCADNALEVMFSPDAARAWGAIIVNGKPIAYLGRPNAAQQSALRDALRQ
jgi:hypothetical protein